jgi:hypothetical protein
LCRVYLPCRLCFGGVFVPGPREVTEALWNTCAAAVATGLTGSVHPSDWCSTGSKPCKFTLCVLMSFGSEGCLLVTRSSSTPVAAWALPTWVVSRRRVFEAVFVLLESPSPSRRIFNGSPFTPPLVAVSVLHYGLLEQIHKELGPVSSLKMRRRRRVFSRLPSRSRSEMGGGLCSGRITGFCSEHGLICH